MDHLPPDDRLCDELCHCRLVHLERVRQARDAAPPEAQLMTMVNVFKAMGDLTRLRILVALLGGEMCVCDLAAYIGVSESAVSHQLRRLKDLCLVRPRREGQILYYTLDDDHVAQMVDICRQHAGHGGA